MWLLLRLLLCVEFNHYPHRHPYTPPEPPALGVVGLDTAREGDRFGGYRQASRDDSR